MRDQKDPRQTRKEASIQVEVGMGLPKVPHVLRRLVEAKFLDYQTVSRYDKRLYKKLTLFLNLNSNQSGGVLGFWGFGFSGSGFTAVSFRAEGFRAMSLELSLWD